MKKSRRKEQKTKPHPNLLNLEIKLINQPIQQEAVTEQTNKQESYNGRQKGLKRIKKTYEMNGSFDALDENGTALIVSRLMTVMLPNVLSLGSAISVLGRVHLDIQQSTTRRRNYSVSVMREA